MQAYDTVNSDILLRKLEKYGIRGVALDILSDFMSNRVQRVRIGSCFSTEECVPTGLPTGSVLSCILFLVYINDLPHISPNISPVVYADDTTLSFSGDSMVEISELCNLELQN